MKLIGKLADDVNKAKDPEEAKSIIRNAGMELSDEEMGQVFGGMGIHRPKGHFMETRFAIRQGVSVFHDAKRYFMAKPFHPIKAPAAREMTCGHEMPTA